MHGVAELNHVDRCLGCNFRLGKLVESGASQGVLPGRKERVGDLTFRDETDVAVHGGVLPG